MFSKKSLCWMVSAVIALTSCTPKVGEAPPEPAQQKLEGTQCLSNLQPVIEAFIAGTASNESVAGAWDCAANGIKMFKKYFASGSTDRFEAEELADFLRENFLAPGSPDITPELRTEFMRMKQLFLGGSLDYVTRAELDKIITMLEDLKSISLQLNPYMKLISQKWSISGSPNVQEDVRYFEKASDEIQVAARALANMINENNQTYEMDHFVTFIREFSIFVNQDWPIVPQLDKLMPIIKKIKKAVSGGDPENIGPSEWRSFVLLGVRGYVQYLRYFYFIKSAADTGSGIRLGYLARSVEDVFSAFQDLMEQKPVDPACGTMIRASGVRQVQACISKQEITDILTSFSDAWTEFRVSPKLVDEAMKIKKVIFGGSENALTSGDFERGHDKVAGFKFVVEKFLPYYAIYSLEWDRANFSEKGGQAFFKESRHSLVSSAEDIGGMFENSYNLESLISLLTEIDRLYPSSDPNHQVAIQLQQYMPLVKDLKNILFSEQDSLIKTHQWAPFLRFAARFYSSYLYHHYFVSEETYGTSAFLESVKTLAEDVLTVVKDMTLLKKNQTITAAEFNQVGQRLVELKILPETLDAKSMSSLVDVILNRVLWPTELRIKGSKPNGLTPTSIGNLRTEIQIWYETERYLYSVAASPIAPTELQSRIARKLKESKISDALRAGLAEMALVVSGPVPQPVDREGRLIITNLQRLHYDSTSAARLNLNRAISRLLIRTSITNLSRLQKYQGVNLAEAQTVFNMVKPVVVAVGLLEEKNTTFMESRFREANMFAAHGNGDSYLSFVEAADLSGMILSGLKVNTLLREDIERICLPSAPMKDPAADEICLRQIYIEKTPVYMTSMPEYVKFFRTLKGDDGKEFLENILKAAGYVPNRQKTVRLADADLAPHVIQYVEMTMSKFDANKNGHINVGEARKAFPAFEGILTELTKDQSLIKQKDLFALFAYILYYGRPPGGVKDFLVKWLPWKRNPEKWNAISADRRDLADILGYIADQVAASDKKMSLVPAEIEDEVRQHPEFPDDEE